VVYDEGLRSYKAIVFIASKSNQDRISKKTISYLILGAPLLQKTVLTKQKTLRCSSKSLGEKNLWIK
jgi:hypothetical protein